MRGGLDDALDKLARRDELRRRAAGESPGTSPAVTELVEAIADVVNRNPKLEVTVGVEGVGDPLLLHFAMEDGVVQVSADNTVASRVSEPEAAAPRHADFEVEVEEPPFVAPAHESRPEAGQETRRISYDDRDRYDPGTGYQSSAEYSHSDAFFSDPPAKSYEPPAKNYEPAAKSYEPAADSYKPPGPSYGAAGQSYEPARGYAERSFSYSESDEPEPHPFAPTPPPQVPTQTTRRIHVEQHRAAEEPGAGQRAPQRAADQRPADQSPAQRGMPEPLPEPIPLRIDAEATEAATRRLAALIRDNPTLLHQSPPD
ncbi:MAG: hypothetical protein QOH97_5324 [Actinoplanes sp.]|jgi:hypothetical protein|nr:hypothetical protein [Actinoplanes sp.]